MADRTPVFRGNPDFVNAFEANPAKLAERLRVVEKQLGEMGIRLTKLETTNEKGKHGTDIGKPSKATGTDITEK